MFSRLRLEALVRGPDGVHDMLLGRDGKWIREHYLGDGDKSVAYVMRMTMADHTAELPWAHLLRLLVASGAADRNTEVDGITAERLLRVVGVPLSQKPAPAPPMYSVRLLFPHGSPPETEATAKPTPRPGLFAGDWDLVIGKPIEACKPVFENVPKDGDCFFHAVIAATDFSPAVDVPRLRKRLAEYIRKDWATQDPLATLDKAKNLEDVAKRVETKGKWTDDEDERRAMGLMLFGNGDNGVIVSRSREEARRNHPAPGERKVHLLLEKNHFSPVLCKGVKKPKVSLAVVKGGAAVPDLPAAPDAPQNPLNGQPFSNGWADAERARRERMPFLRDEELARLRKALDRSRVVVVSADVGAGKTTQVPKILLGWLRARTKDPRVVVTSPRAAPAIELAGQLARELDVQVGKEVGYKTRHDKRYSPDGVLTMVTEGTLVAQSLGTDGAEDPTLGYTAWVLDEVHERTVDVDLLMLQALDIAADARFPDFRAVVMSATADTEGFLRYFKEGGVATEHVHVANRTFPIAKHFLPAGEAAPRDYVTACVDRALEICARPVPEDRRDRDDVLVFLATKSDLEKAEAQFERRAKADPKVRGRARGYVLSADTDREDLRLHTGAACRAGGEPEAGCASELGVERKVIFSTNVAETSLTFATLRYVVDSARALVAGFDSEAGVAVLENTRVTQANARQRAGRVGRTAPGDAYILVSEAEYAEMAEFAPPEVETTELTPVFLRLLVAAGGERGLEGLAADRLRRLIRTPDGATLTHAIRRLTRFHAIAPEPPYPVTDLGRAIAELAVVGVDMAYALLTAPAYECEEEVAAIAAIAQNFASVDQAFVPPEDGRRVPFPDGAKRAKSDLELLLRAYHELRERRAEGPGAMFAWGRENHLYMRKWERIVRDEVPDLLRRAAKARETAAPSVQPRGALPRDPVARTVQCLADCLPEQRLVARGPARVLAGSGAAVKPRLSRTFAGLARALGTSRDPLLYLNLTRDAGRRVASLLAPVKT